MALKPGATIGIIGGGQLGRMLAMAAARLGLQTCVLEPGKDCPASQATNRHLNYAYDDEEGLAELAAISDVVTYEFENVPIKAARILEHQTTLQPPARALEVSQDRLVEKQFLNHSSIATAGFYDISTRSDLQNALDEFGGCGILKTRRLGYDGKGQIRIDKANAADLAAILAQFEDTALILEQLIEFEREISVIAVRGANGNFKAYDPAWNIHRDGILRKSTVPAGVSAKLAAAATDTAHRIMDALSYVGVMGTEFFVTRDGRLLVNEIAPRVHNSGHWTEAACTISQFEQHIRAIAGWPLGNTDRHSSCTMENIIGHEVDNIHLAPVGASKLLHLYGKKDARQGRKMGHITHLKPIGSG